ncbi:unnamed protein product [Hydatigera taeniaeformis]|uniref:26S proteasome non-ATPase regulatory subunit 14 n=1 Tax=Hydatigena taeniaeformis TaxID=6205 RepID=A0A0R3X5M7_HYDTA|nr:unnamed protein product [Hydatigera taeniaeformis]
MERLLRFGADGLAFGQPASQPTDGPVPDTAEQVYISSLALLKMLKHGRAGVPMEVMGLMLGEFVDDYTVTVVDVFAMPQSGTGVSVEAVDPVFQAKMIDMLKQTGRPEMVVGWYHSHPGFGCWLSGVDMNTQQSFEALSDRAVAVVVDPIQSVKGKVVIDAFRLINPNMVIANQEPRQTTSNLGHLNKPSIQALIHGLNRHYYSLPINYRKNKREQTMLMNLDKRTWQEGLTLEDYSTHCNANHKTLLQVLDLVKTYNKSLEDEEKMTPEQLAIKNVGKMDPKRHLEENVDELVASVIMKRQLTEAERQRIEKNRQEALIRRQRAMEFQKKNANVRSQASSGGTDQIQGNVLVAADRGRLERNRQDALNRRQFSSSVLGTNRGLSQQASVAISNRCQKNVQRTTSASSGLLSQILRGSAPKTTNVNTNPVVQKRPESTLSAPSAIEGNGVRLSKMPLLRGKSKVRAVCVLVSREEFEVQTRYHAGLVLVFKSMPTRIYVRKASTIDDVQLEGLSSAVVTTFKEKIDSEGSTPVQKEICLEDWIPRHLIDSLMDFQREGVKFALRHEGRVLLADDMGLGKTVQALAIAAAYRSEWPLLVVTPLSLRCAWREAALRWLGSSPLSLSRDNIHVVASLNDALDSMGCQQQRKPVTIVTYDLLSRYAEKLGRTVSSFKVVIMDESHNLKNIKTSRTKSALPILQAAKRAILLTGTPALSRPLELYPQITGIRPNFFCGGFHEFGLRYCGAKEKVWGWDYSGCSNLRELQILLRETIMIRRVKSEVLGQLPPKLRQVMILDPDLVNESPGGKSKHLENLASLDLHGIEKHGEMLRLFMQTCQAKIPAVCQYITDLLEEDRKFILYAHHQEMLDAMSRSIESKQVEYIRIDGKTPPEQRRALCDRFQNESDCRVALLSITAASTGLNLTAANLVVFAELFWNPGVLVQAEDRAHRIGQQDSVNIHYLLASGTVDDQLWSLVKNKLDVLGQVGLNQESFDNVDLSRAKLLSKQPTASNMAPKIDHFFTPANDSTTTSESMNENLQPAATPQEDEMACKEESSSTRKKPRISILFPPVSSPISSADEGAGRGSVRKILVPDSPPPPLENTESLEDDADELLGDVLEAAVLNDSLES